DVIQAMTNPDGQLQLNAVIAAKAYSKSREIGEVLAGCLGAESEILRGRALDSILSNTTLLAKRAAIRHLEMNIGNDEVVDKVYRDFDPEKKGGEEFFRQVSDLLKSNPDHPHWEKLVSLRDRLKSGHAEPEVPGKPESAEVTVIDQRLIEMIPGFAGLDLTAKLALRAAEQPFIRAEGEANLPIDKAPSVLEFCKALDLVLERHLGQKHLFPKLDRELHDFQTLWHRVGFGEDYPQTDRVMGLLGLKGKIAPEAFPLHKAKQMCGAFFNGKILQDRFKIFDGLRAWAVIFLVFSRKVQIQGVDYGPLIRLPHLSDEKILVMAKRLMTLQDLRNPAAHRQTYPEIESIKLVRSEAIELINWIAGAKIG
ncbi:hypothetical protein EBZ37_12775, partial [bacterium]|nr:hypothetical protein [bacterium]